MFLVKSNTSHHDRILKHLKKAGRFGEYNHVLARQNVGGLAWHRRITDLRKEGHNIIKVRLSTGTFKYYLIPDNK